MTHSRSILGFFLLTIFGFALSACSTMPTALLTNASIPAARGSLRVDESENNNTSIDLEVEHLAPPQRISANATTYVVWLRPSALLPNKRQPAGSRSQIQNIGALQVDKDLNGRLKTVTPYRDFEIFVTAEPTATDSSPTGSALLWTQVSQ